MLEFNARIEHIVSEATWYLANEKVKLRSLHQNTGGTLDCLYTSDKIVCKCCGKNFYICHIKKGSGINSYQYYIRAIKKKEGKGENVTNEERLIKLIK